CRRCCRRCLRRRSTGDPWRLRRSSSAMNRHRRRAGLLKEAEASAAEERRSLAELERLAAQPVRLLSPAEVRERLQQIEALVVSSPIEAREHLRRIFASGKIRLRLNADGVFVALAEILGEILLVETRTPAAGFSP